MERLPDAWIDRIFLRLSEVYLHRWAESWGNPEKKSLYTAMWSSALSGLSVEEIKKALKMCADYPQSPIPTPIEFYHHAKGIVFPYRVKPIEKTAINTAIANANLTKMKNTLSGKNSRQEASYV